MTRLRQLIHEIHRRSLWQVLGIYLVGSWLVLRLWTRWPVPSIYQIGLRLLPCSS